MRETVGLCVALLALAGSTPAAAQLLVSGGAGWYAPEIEILPEIEAGPGLDGSLRVGIADRLQAGAGVQYNVHSVGDASDRYEVVVPFVELRFLVPVRSGRWTPFVAPRAGWVRHSLRLFGRDVRGSGHFFGGMAGIAFRPWTAVEVEAGVAWYRASVDDVDLDLGGFELDLDDLHADVPGLRLAVVWRPSS